MFEKRLAKSSAFRVSRTKMNLIVQVDLVVILYANRLHVRRAEKLAPIAVDRIKVKRLSFPYNDRAKTFSQSAFVASTSQEDTRVPPLWQLTVKLPSRESKPPV
jgi:hypothetical protein